MRRILAVVAIALAICLFLTGCRPLVETEETTISLYATFYPIYALTDALITKVPNVQLHCLVQPQDGCLRSYALSDWDIYMLASSADAVIMGGRGLESFENTLFSWENQGPAVAAVLYNLELYNQSDGDNSDDESSHLDGANPHLYMSLDGASQIIESIAASLMSVDPDYSHVYNSNAEIAIGAIEDVKDQIGDHERFLRNACDIDERSARLSGA